MSTTTLDLDARYAVRGWKGIAFRIWGFPQVWEPNTALVVDDETGEESEEDTGEGEWIDGEDHGRVIVVMVGDDRKHEVDTEDLTKIDEDAYCHSCGQIGCSHG